MFHFLWMVLIGFLVGGIAKLLTPGRDPGGCLITILLGIAGSLVAGFIGRMVGLYAPGEPAGFFMSILGALLILWVHRQIRRRGTSGPSGP
jgi:uncharacterized membrane protein YeaQ/YmgE (transglycosylase-associated protein family)